MSFSSIKRRGGLLLSVVVATSALTAADHVFTEALFSGRLSTRNAKAEARLAVFQDPIFQRYVDGVLLPPQVGDLAGEDNHGTEHHWIKIQADADGVFTHRGSGLRSGYLYFTHDSPRAETVVLHAVGAFELFVNGEPRGGDVYGNGRMLLPVKLKQGRNDFWMHVGPRARRHSMRLIAPEKPIYLTESDPTMPDFLTNEIDDKWGAIRVVNTTGKTIDGLSVTARSAGVTRTTVIGETVTPLAVRKFGFTVHDGASGPGKEAVEVSLWQDGELLDQLTLMVEVKEPSRNYRRTFASAIDGSVQYYGVREAKYVRGPKPGLIFSVHGAGVQALGQAGSYKTKDWAHVIAPTNRREYGFDWEDWGRLDALEVFADAAKRYPTDPERTYLTGHSMGGHGTWTLGANYAERWAAIAPMAGWRTFYSYVHLENYDAENPLGVMMNRANNPSRTTALARNYLNLGVFIEHGDADRSVSVEEARGMRQLLSTFHPDFEYHEEADGGHWYGVDHDRTMEFFQRHERIDLRDLSVLEFRSVSPGISATNRYITLYQQERSYAFCGVVAEQTIRSRRQRRNEEDIAERSIRVTTENLKVFRMDLAHCSELEALTLEVDEQLIADLPWPQQSEVWLEKEGANWTVVDAPADSTEKNPARYGGFKDAFRHRVVFVYGTVGTAEENAWAYQKARFDESTFYSHGNGSIEIIPDHAFSLGDYPDRSVILYGNRETNRAWSVLLQDSPVQVSRESVEVGGRELLGQDLGVFMIRPRAGSPVASVGVVAGTTLKGMRTVVHNRYFPPGTGMPDLMIIEPKMYSGGLGGVVAAGYFGNDWSVEQGEIVWRDER